ncbi:unnamed protein product [Candidula unifasciata]|uniref:Large proline-rich protein BAG6 n=1 Tax=Candidula unifasciata TaxID=100452 RepID=A0A8S3ZXK9_9EUPU|nr:unnamed protein product [Candidula unifasciata]
MTSEPGQSSMIDITVKTLDGQNRTFSVSDNSNVRQFKEKISSTIEIPADSQRLIFQGRVMQDDKMLKDYNVHGKVIHLVQRAPPSTLSSSTTSNPTVKHSNIFNNQATDSIHLGRLQSTPNTREARARIRQADFNLRLINDVLSQFERLGPRPGEHNGDLSALGTESSHARPARDSEDIMDTSSTPEASSLGQSQSREHPQQPLQGSSEGVNSESPEASVSDQHTSLMATELADFLDQVLNTNDRMMTHIRQYQNLLRSEENYTANSREAQNAQEVVSRVNEVFHALGHMLHSLSDITVDMNTSVPRQAVALSPVPFQIPGTASMAIPIHMNVRTRPEMNRNRQRTGQSNSSEAPATDSRSTAATPQNCTAAASSTNTNTTAVSTANTAGITAGSTASTAGSTASTAGITAGSTASTAGSTSIQIPPVSLPLPLTSMPSGDSAVMVEVYPTSVTVHDISAVVTPGAVEVAADACLDGNRANITVTSATTVEHPLVAPATSATTTAALTAASRQPSTQTPAASSFTTSSTSSSTFTFGPATSVSFGGVTNLASGQIPNVPGLPPGMLQNILGSILSSHGMQPVQVNVVQQLTTVPSSSIPVQQPVFDLPLDNERTRSQNQSQTFNLNGVPVLAAPSAGVNAGTFVHMATNLNSTGAVSGVNAPTNTSLNTAADTTTTSSSAGSNMFTSTFHLPTGQQLSTIPLPSSSTRSRSGNQLHIQTVYLSMCTMPEWDFSVDPYLPCASPQYMSPTALAALSALQEQTRSQQPQQQVPNLSTMVSGMVGEIIGQVGQALNNAARTSSSAATGAASQSSTSSIPGARTGAASSISGELPPNLNELFSQFLNVASDTNQASSFPPEMGPMISGIMQAAVMLIFISILFPQSTAATATSRGSPAIPNWTLADLFSQVRTATEDRAGESSVIISLLEAVAPHVGIPDLFSLVMGGAQVLTRVRRPLQEFVRSLVSRHGSVQQLVEVALKDMHVDIQYLQGLVQVKEGVDMAQSIRICLRAHLLAIFGAIDSDSENFGEHLYALWVKMLAESIALCVYCIRDGHAGFLSMLQNYVPRMTQGMSPVFTNWMTAALQSILGSFYSNHPIAEADIRGYVVQQSDLSVISRCTESDVCTQANHSSSRQSVRHVCDISPKPDGHYKVPSLAVARNTLREDDSTQKPCENIQQAAPSQQPAAKPPSTLATQVHQTEGATGGGRSRHDKGSDDWQSVVPQEWIPVISRDLVKQQEQKPQPPFSDAYLQGFPAKRRRMMTLEHCHEMGNMQHYLPESIKRAARSAGVEPCSHEDILAQEAANNLDLQAELEGEMISVLDSRISSDPDFSSDRFPNAEEYFHKSKHH